MTKPIKQQQFDLIHKLREEKDLSKIQNERQRKFLEDPSNVQRLNKDQADNAIQLLFKLPSIAETKVGEGRYFIVDPTNGEERFFKVDKPTEGRWAGYTFVNVQASDDFYPVRDREHREEILAEIAKDPVKAMNEYGIRLGYCGRCGRTLTNIDSRLRGLGPICAGRVRQEYAIEMDYDEITNLIEDA
jgi:Family of unknown function (DUF6011)